MSTHLEDTAADDELQYLSPSRVATHFGGEDLCSRAVLSRRVGSDGRNTTCANTSVSLTDYNDRYIEAMINRDHKRGQHLTQDMTDYEVESMINAIFESKLEMQSNYSSDNELDEDIAVGMTEEDVSKDWIPNVFLPPKRDVDVLEADYRLDFNESLDTCLDYSAFKAPKAYDSYQKAFGFDKWFLSRLKRVDCKDVSLELHLWPSILKGYSISCISGAKSGKTNSYLIPLMYRFDNPDDCDSSEKPNIGAIIICSSTRQTYEIARQARQWRDPEAKQTVIGFSDTQYLIIDEADICLNVHIKTIREIYIAFGKAKREECEGLKDKNWMAFQTMVFCEKWTKGVEWFAKEIQHMPLVSFGSYYELSIAFKIECHLQVITEEQRENTVLAILERCKQTKTRIAIVCTKVQEIQYLQKCLNAKHKCIVVTHQTNHYDLERLSAQWVRNTVLLINDSAIKQVSGFKRCQTIIHYKLPYDFNETFGNRFRLMRSWLKRYKTVFNTQNTHQLNHYIIATHEDRQQMPQLMAYLKRLKMKIPNELAKIYGLERRSLCPLYCSLAKCPFESFDCPLMHSFGRCDRPVETLPKSGQIKIGITFVLNANHFYFRINEFRGESQTSGKWQSIGLTYDDIKEELNALKDMPFNTVPDVVDGEVYGIAIRGQVFRVRLTQILGNEEINFYEDYDPKNTAQKVELFCIDFGHKVRSNSRQLFELPAHLKSYSPFAFRGYLFGIKPIDNEIEWDFRATQKVYELVDNYRISEITAWILKQIDGVFWINRLNVQKKLKNAKLNIETNITEYLIKHKYVEQNDSKLSNVNSDYNRIVNIWLNDRLNTSAYNSCLVDESSYVVVSDWVTINEFYVIHENRIKRLQEFEDKWTASLESLNLLPEVTAQQICFYKYFDSVYNETSLNRAKVVAIKDHLVDLFLVDHGQTVTNVLKDSLYTIQDSHLKELPFQAIKVSLFGVQEVKPITYDIISIKVSLFGVQEVKPITYDIICDLTRNKEDKYLLSIAQKVDPNLSSNVIRLFVSNNETETQFVSLSKLLVDLGLCRYIDGEESNELQLTIQISLETDEECGDYLQSIEDKLVDNFVKQYCLKTLSLDENEDIDYGTDGKSSNGTKESRITRKLRQLRDIRKNRIDDISDDSDEDDCPLNGVNAIDLLDYKPIATNGNIAYYDPEDDLDRDSPLSDEDDIIDEQELS
ncbi:unnamed protein product [Medioppia subpectinata]|uniref:RNA helicase n=1 Tax=Medioppia subpectinata TaxID=1979941 RepID=A0A7R9KWG3_9ACAR|nr:unnamed protein product [Medioppia subpectinata]CAG2111095.1 unnamed protein product [Medioppia subpectinata]